MNSSESLPMNGTLEDILKDILEDILEDILTNAHVLQ
jgi:hypothetical protein